jgi:hypothetical protein
MSLEHPVELPWLSSHIDVAPSVLTLLGMAPPMSMQGSPVWHPALKDRTTFFFGNHYMGADGFHRQGHVFMRAHMTEPVYAGQLPLGFDERRLMRRDGPVHNDVSRATRRMVELQETWVRQFPGNKPLSPD